MFERRNVRGTKILGAEKFGENCQSHVLEHRIVFKYVNDFLA